MNSTGFLFPNFLLVCGIIIDTINCITLFFYNLKVLLLSSRLPTSNVTDFCSVG